MGWLDKAKIALGIIDVEDAEDDGPPRAAKRLKLDGGGKDGRPSLDGLEAAPQETLEDVLAARERGDTDEMRSLLKRIDRGRGLRVVLRAAAALEAGDQAEVDALKANVVREAEGWKLPLQLAASVDDARRELLRAIGTERGAPGWAVAWMDATSDDVDLSRTGMVDLLFADRALARTVACRDLQTDDVVADPAAGHRYVSFAHGRNCIEQFGADPVIAILVSVESLPAALTEATHQADAPS